MNGAQRYLPDLEWSTALILYGVFWTIVCGAATLLGRADWRKKRAPILGEIRRLRLDLLSGS
jgi:hypothetical protein